MLMFTITCPRCRGKFRVYLRQRGMKVKCPKCGASGTVPICRKEGKP